jgi:hypothetical protein
VRASTKTKAPNWVRIVVDEVRKWAGEQFAKRGDVEALGRALAELETKVAAVETRSGAGLIDVYAGVWHGDRDYKRGEVVTHHGGLWLTLEDSARGDKPGASSNFKLVVKAGRDGKALR